MSVTEYDDLRHDFKPVQRVTVRKLSQQDTTLETSRKMSLTQGYQRIQRLTTHDGGPEIISPKIVGVTRDTRVTIVP